MGTYWFDIALIAVLMLLNAVFAGSEIALISLREGQLRQLERRGGRRAHTLVRLARDPNRYLATIQIGITLAGYLASATAAVTLSKPLVSLFDFLGGAAEATSIAVVTVALAFVNLVVGELAPKRLAMQHPLRWALLLARPLDVLSSLARPVIWLLSSATDVIVRRLSNDSGTDRNEPTSKELRDLVATHRGLTTDQRTMITGALEIQQRALRDVLVPRPAVLTLPSDMPAEQARVVLATSGHSRAPVVESGNLDDVLGVVHLRDLLAARGTVAPAARATLRFPESVRVADALRRFRSAREQFALVIDEHGGVAGIVTVEDLLEEIVGEIYDDSDRDVQSVQFLPDGSCLLPGTFPVHDLPDIGVDLGDCAIGDFTTIAGLVLVALGRIPTQPGDRVDANDWTIDVTQIARRALTEVRLTPRER